MTLWMEPMEAIEINAIEHCSFRGAVHVSCSIRCEILETLLLQVARGGHRKGILAKHTCCAGNTWYVDLAEEEMKKTLGK